MALPAGEALAKDGAEGGHELRLPFFSIFVLAIFVGYYVVWSVTPALHTPLMSVTNAISSVIVVGALLAVASRRPRLRASGKAGLPSCSVSPRSSWRASTSSAASSSPSACSPCIRRKRNEPGMSNDLVALLYLVAGVLFILALRGLSSPETSRQGNYLGMTGMAIAVLTTLAVARPPTPLTWAMILGGIAIGGGIGAVTARRIPMTAMPELVAAFHSLVGLAAVLVAAAAFYAPEAFGIGTPGAIHTASLIEMSLGVAIGAITFTGSVIAFLKLSGRMSGKPIILPARHVINIALALAARRSAS